MNGGTKAKLLKDLPDKHHHRSGFAAGALQVLQSWLNVEKRA